MSNFNSKVSSLNNQPKEKKESLNIKTKYLVINMYSYDDLDNNSLGAIN